MCWFGLNKVDKTFNETALFGELKFPGWLKKYVNFDVECCKWRKMGEEPEFLRIFKKKRSMMIIDKWLRILFSEKLCPFALIIAIKSTKNFQKAVSERKTHSPMNQKGAGSNALIIVITLCVHHAMRTDQMMSIRVWLWLLHEKRSHETNETEKKNRKFTFHKKDENLTLPSYPTKNTKIKNSIADWTDGGDLLEFYFMLISVLSFFLSTFRSEYTCWCENFKRFTWTKKKMTWRLSI